MEKVHEKYIKLLRHYKDDSETEICQRTFVETVFDSG